MKWKQGCRSKFTIACNLYRNMCILNEVNRKRWRHLRTNKTTNGFKSWLLTSPVGCTWKSKQRCYTIFINVKKNQGLLFYPVPPLAPQEVIISSIPGSKKIQSFRFPLAVSSVERILIWKKKKSTQQFLAQITESRWILMSKKMVGRFIYLLA